MCFSPVKNATSDGVTLQANGTHPGVAASGEADQSAAARRLLRSIGCQIAEGDSIKFSGIQVVSGPDIVLKPSFAVCSVECKKKFPTPSEVKISGRSSLVVKGEGLTIESLDLDGALVIECSAKSGVIRNLSVCNKGWVKVPISDNDSVSEVIRMRGYYMKKLETRRIVIKEDGSIDDNCLPEAQDLPLEVEEPTKTTNHESELTERIREEKMINDNNNLLPPSPGIKALNKQTQPVVARTKEEVHVDLSKPASSEGKEKDTLCGGACIIL